MQESSITAGRRRAQGETIGTGKLQKEAMTSVQHVGDNDDSSHWFDVVVRETVGGVSNELGTQRIVTNDLQSALRIAADLPRLSWMRELVDDR
jgi:hypothetical protein